MRKMTSSRPPQHVVVWHQTGETCPTGNQATSVKFTHIGYDIWRSVFCPRITYSTTRCEISQRTLLKPHPHTHTHNTRHHLMRWPVNYANSSGKGPRINSKTRHHSTKQPVQKLRRPSAEAYSRTWRQCFCPLRRSQNKGSTTSTRPLSKTTVPWRPY